MINHNHQAKVAVINDFTSFGRCSLAVTIPILSVLKVQCCAVPTAIFTNHTGFPFFSWQDCTSAMDAYIHDWQKIDLQFRAVQSGFLGSQKQIDYVKRFVHTFQNPDLIVCIDPVMGDYGQLYPTYDRARAEAMREFLSFADILTPNLTEACVLAEQTYDPTISEAGLKCLCEKLCAQHVSKVVISGIPRGENLLNYVYERDYAPHVCAEKKCGEDRSGTGDVFAAIILADAVNGVDFRSSVARASHFVAHAVRRSMELQLPETDGLAIEEVMKDLLI